MVFRSSIARPTDTPIYASTSTSRCSLQDSGPRWIRFSFLVGLFHSQQHAGLSRRTYDSKTVYALSDQKGPEKFAGQKVKITGTYNEATKILKVDSMAATAK